MKDFAERMILLMGCMTIGNYLLKVKRIIATYLYLLRRDCTSNATASKIYISIIERNGFEVFDERLTKQNVPPRVVAGIELMVFYLFDCQMFLPDGEINLPCTTHKCIQNIKLCHAFEVDVFVNPFETITYNVVADADGAFVACLGSGFKM